MNHPFWGPVVAKANCIRVTNRGCLPNNPCNNNKLTNKKHIAIFPEGTRSPSGDLLNPKKGVAKIAVQKKLPIIPTGLIGFYEAWPRHNLFPKPHKLKIVFGRPLVIYNSEISPSNLNIEAIKIMDEIKILLDKERAQ